MQPLPPAGNTPSVQARRQRAQRTALLFAGIALAVYLGFILSQVVGR
ncbi:hypothetical protein [Thermomonas sp.]